MELTIGHAATIALDARGTFTTDSDLLEATDTGRALGFRIDPFSPTLDLSFALAIMHPEITVGLHLVYEDAEGHPHAVLAPVTAVA